MCDRVWDVPLEYAVEYPIDYPSSTSLVPRWPFLWRLGEREGAEREEIVAQAHKILRIDRLVMHLFQSRGDLVFYSEQWEDHVGCRTFCDCNQKNP